MSVPKGSNFSKVANRLAYNFTTEVKSIIRDIILDLEPYEVESLLLGTFYMPSKFNDSKTRKSMPTVRDIELPHPSQINLKDFEEARIALISLEFKNLGNSSQARKITCDLEFRDFLRLVTQRCTYCGKLPSKERSTLGFTIFISGLDRKDCEIGYSRENCVPCCHHCNSAKGVATYDEFIRRSRLKMMKGTTTDIDFYRHIVEYQRLKSGEYNKLGPSRIFKNDVAPIGLPRPLINSYKNIVCTAETKKLPKTPRIPTDFSADISIDDLRRAVDSI